MKHCDLLYKADVYSNVTKSAQSLLHNEYELG